MLDTHVWLDLLLFRDPCVAALDAALRSGRVIAIVDARMSAELVRVLAYPVFDIGVDRQREIAATAVVLSVGVPLPTPSQLQLQPLPRCRDPDDQMFLALARASGARWLFSRDLALLELSRRLQRSDGCAVVTPEAWPGGDA